MFSASFSLILSKWGGSTICKHREEQTKHWKLLLLRYAASALIGLVLQKITCIFYYYKLSLYLNHTLIDFIMCYWSTITQSPGSALYLAGVHRCGGESCLAQGDCGSQQVFGCGLVLTRLQPQLLPGQHRLVARGVTWRRQELKLPVTTPQEETHPAVGQTRSQGGFIVQRVWWPNGCVYFTTRQRKKNPKLAKYQTQ